MTGAYPAKPVRCDYLAGFFVWCEIMAFSEAKVHRLKRLLREKGRRRGLTGERLDAYVFGTLRKMGWKPSREK